MPADDQGIGSGIGISNAQFLRDYWQQQALHIPSAVPDFRDPLSPEELAGLACEDDIESRLIFRQDNTWSMRPGPFRESDFTALSGENWTLMVQSVDLWLPQLKSLFELVNFLPGWRLDDLLISYATPGAGAGPHFDYYDVFILQGSGTRHWQLGQHCDEDTPLDTRSGLKILQHFEDRQSIELRCGDILYIPAGMAHHGTSADNSLSYSIGFRAPSLKDMIMGFGADVLDQLREDQRYRDPAPALPVAGSRNEITPAVGRQLRSLLLEALDDQELLVDWFGRHMTEPRYPELIEPTEDMIEMEALKALLASKTLEINPVSRMAWQATATELVLYCDGEEYRLEKGPQREHFIAALCDQGTLPLLPTPASGPHDGRGRDQDKDEGLWELLRALYHAGALGEAGTFAAY